MCRARALCGGLGAFRARLERLHRLRREERAADAGSSGTTGRARVPGARAQTHRRPARELELAMLTEILERRAAITGVGLAMAGRRADRSALNLTLDAIFEALGEAGLRDSDIDGLSSWPGISATPGMAPVTLREVKESLGLKLNWFAASPEAPGQLSAVMNAAMAVACGQARHVLCFRTLNQYSAQLQRRSLSATAPQRVQGLMSWIRPF